MTQESNYHGHSVSQVAIGHRNNLAWTPAKDGDTPGEIIPGEEDYPPSIDSQYVILEP